MSELSRRFSKRRLAFYRPYPKQEEFHEAGRSYRERALLAGNQTGKTFSAANEVAMHLTGEYPEWWKGHVYGFPPLWWTGSETNETSREIIQSALLGTESADIKSADMGTGAIPGDRIKKITTRLAGVKDVVDQILVRHVSGGTSRCVLKTYDQGRTKWQGKKVNGIWGDEEMPADIYSEALTRTQAAEGGRMMSTFTPLLGLTEVVKKFLHPEDKVPRHLTMMTIEDAGHYTPDQRREIIDSYPAWERKTRAQGIPMAGRGMVFPVDIDKLSIQPFELPSFYRHIAGVDFGINHPAAATWLAYDPQSSIMYVYDSYRQKDMLPPYHAGAVKSRDPHNFIPVAWPHDGLNREKASGKTLKDQYKLHGVNMMRDSARYEDDKGGRQDIEPSIQEILEWMQEGRFRIFSTNTDLFEELRLYHRDDNGNVVAERDDIISAVRYAFMMRRKARTKTEFRPRRPRYDQPICGGRL